MLDYLQQLISFHSVSSDQNAVKQLLEYVAKHLKKVGYTVEIKIYNGIYNLYASPTGNAHSRVLLQGHVDVVPGGQPFTMLGDKYYGRGTYDMLFAVAAFMKLAEELHQEGKEHDIAIMLSGDEEIGGFNGVYAMLQDGFTTDVCILPDAGEGWGSINASAKGLYVPTIRIHGQSHHGSRPWEGDSASSKLIHFLAEIEPLFDLSDKHNSMLTISILKAGDVYNQGPSEAEATLDIRYKDKADLARIVTGMQPLLKKYNGEIISKLEGNDYKLDIEAPLVKKFIDIYEKHVGEPIKFDRAFGSSDARFFADKEISVIAVRPDGGEIHSDHEWISIPGYQKFYDLLKEYTVAIATKV